ncbi:MAG: hypothetical protein QXN87_08520 [Candidatus Bathyarchaeia archaeon]
MAECDDRNLKPNSYDKVKEHVETLCCMGLINRRAKGVCIVGAPVEDLSRILTTMRRGEHLEGCW